MQTTKAQILALLKRHGRGTVDTLTEVLGLAPMTVRQHLAGLERDGLIVAHEERQRKGRPHFVFALTEKGEESFPKRYDRLAAQVLAELGRVDAEEIAALTAAQRTALIFNRIADRVVELHAHRLVGCALDERVQEVAAILQEESGFAEWARTDEGYEIRDYNCVYRRLAGDNLRVCTWHQRVISRLLGEPIQEDPPQSPGGVCCRFVVAATERANGVIHGEPTRTFAVATRPTTG